VSVRVESEFKRLPHLRPFARQAIVFLTVCTSHRRPLLANEAAHEVLRTVWTKAAADYGWYVGRYVLMPDHVHLFVQAGFEEKRL
jgi:REP element-mobilizing transposase RayT